MGQAVLGVTYVRFVLSNNKCYYFLRYEVVLDIAGANISSPKFKATRGTNLECLPWCIEYAGHIWRLTRPLACGLGGALRARCSRGTPTPSTGALSARRRTPAYSGQYVHCLVVCASDISRSAQASREHSQQRVL